MISEKWQEKPRAMDMGLAKIVLLEVKKVLDVLQVEFFLNFGTCLGAIREQNFIDIDFDIDLGIKHLHLLPKLNVIKSVFDVLGYETHYLASPYSYNRMLKLEKFNIRVDLINWDLHKGFYFNPIQPSGECHVIPQKLFDNLVEIDFLGEKFKIPSPVEEYLVLLYGENWRTKDENHSIWKSVCIDYDYWKGTLLKERDLI